MEGCLLYLTVVKTTQILHGLSLIHLEAFIVSAVFQSQFNNVAIMVALVPFVFSAFRNIEFFDFRYVVAERCFDISCAPSLVGD